MNLLLIFVKNPIAGEVKTRLAADIGNEKALKIYQKLLLHTRQISANLLADKHIYFGNEIPKTDIWSEVNYLRFPQKGDDLGERMANAFAEGFEKHYEKIVIIGSDCWEINTEIIEQAFDKLNDHDCVIGPAKDGGYYLLGMKKLHSFLFQNKAWSSAIVLQQTFEEIKNHALSFSLLPLLHDIDTIHDLNQALLHSQKNNSILLDD